MRVATWIPLSGGALMLGLAGCSGPSEEANEAPAKPTEVAAMEKVASEPVRTLVIVSMRA